MAHVQTNSFDLRMMQRAAILAQNGYPSPNPHVGAVIVKNGKILAEGFHAQVGRDHAEVVAIKRALASNKSTRGATLYVTMTPCHHYGRTPPCTKAIIEAGIGRVVIGSKDPKPHKRGAVRALRACGIEVLEGVGDSFCDPLIRDFKIFITRRRPFVIAKSAITIDGKVATRRFDSKWISDPIARQDVQRQRDRSDAILVGMNTVFRDDPQLTVRIPRKQKRPQELVRIILDPYLQTPLSTQVMKSARKYPTWLVHGPEASPHRIRQMRAMGATCLAAPTSRLHRHPRADRDADNFNLLSILEQLASLGIVRLWVEGGPRTTSSFLRHRLIDEWLIYLGPKLLGDDQGLSLAHGRHVDWIHEAISLRFTDVRQIGQSIRIRCQL